MAKLRLGLMGLLPLVAIGCMATAPGTPVGPAAAVGAMGAELDQAAAQALMGELAQYLQSGDPAAPLTLDPAKAFKLNRDLTADAAMRDRFYKVSDDAVARHLSKPGKADTLAPLTPAEVQSLIGKLQPGDIIQCGNDGSFVHAAVYTAPDTIIHSLAEAMHGRKMVGVIKESLSGYCKRVARDQIVVLRAPWTPEKWAKGLAFAEAQVGKEYDSLFLVDNTERFFCTELAYNVLTRGGVARVQPQLVKGVWPMVLNEDLRKSPDLKVVFRKNRS